MKLVLEYLRAAMLLVSAAVYFGLHGLDHYAEDVERDAREGGE